MFILDKNIEQNSFFIKSLEFSELRLQNNSAFPWLVLIPRIVDKCEIFELSEEENMLLMNEIRYISKFLKENFQADKINIASFGNVVKQLHIHIFARFHNDVCWPKSPWHAESIVYDESSLNTIRGKLRSI